MRIIQALKETDLYEALREYHHSEGYEGEFDVYAMKEIQKLLSLLLIDGAFSVLLCTSCEREVKNLK